MTSQVTLVPNDCLFCFTGFLPYIVTYSSEIGTSGETIIDESSVSLTPNFEKLCNYLGLTFPDLCYRRRLKSKSGNEGSSKQSIFKAPADRFLCLSCFEKVNHLRILNDQLKEVMDKIADVTKAIKNVVIAESTSVTVSQEEVDQVAFTKSFGQHLIKITEESHYWKAEREVIEAVLDIKEEIIEEEVCTEEVNEVQLNSTDNVPLCDLSSEAEDDIEDPLHQAELDTASRKLHVIAGSICLPKVKKAEIEVCRQEVFPCPHCNKCYRSIQYLGVHISSKHSRKKGGATGEKCPLHVKSRVVLNGETFFQCSFCQKKYEKVKALRNHIARNHPPGKASTATPVVTCDQCPTYKTFKTQQLLDRHIFSMHTTGPKYKCPTCSKGFYSKQSRNQHEAAEHKGIRFKCEFCTKYFTNGSLVKRHILIAHHNDKSYKCSSCQGSFVSAGDLKRHSIIHDDTLSKDNVCDVCGVQFVTRARLTAHISKVHQKESKNCDQVESKPPGPGCLNSAKSSESSELCLRQELPKDQAKKQRVKKLRNKLCKETPVSRNENNLPVKDVTGS